MLVRLASLLLLAPSLASQSAATAPARSEPLVDTLVANAEQYRVTQPSFTADEAIDSRLAVMLIYRSHVKAEGTFRVTDASIVHLVEAEDVLQDAAHMLHPPPHARLTSILLLL